VDDLPVWLLITKLGKKRKKKKKKTLLDSNFCFFFGWAYNTIKKKLQSIDQSHVALLVWFQWERSYISLGINFYPIVET
jgi:hypothetical protein